MIDDKDQKTVDWVVDEFESAENEHKKLVSKLDEYDSILNVEYEGVQSVTSYGRSMFAIPKTYGDVMSKIAKIWVSILGRYPFFQLSPQEESDKMSAEANQALAEFDFRQCDTSVEAFKIITQLVSYGWAAANVYWKKERGVKYKYNFDKQKGALVGTPTDEIIYDCPWFECEDLRLLYLDPRATSVKKSEFLIRRRVKSYRELLEQAEHGEYIGNIEDIDWKKAPKYIEDIFDTSLIKGNIRYVEVLERQSNDKFVTIANRQIVIREPKGNPYHHKHTTVIDFVAKPVMSRLLGKGDIEPVVPLQHALDTTFNQIEDHVNFTVNPVPIVTKGFGIQGEKELELRAGRPLFVQDAKAISWMEYPELNSEVFGLLGSLNDAMEHANGNYRYSQGMTPERRETASGIMVLNQAASPRFEVETKIAARTGFTELVKRFVQLRWQFTSMEEVVPIIGKRGIFFPNLLGTQLQSETIPPFFYPKISPKDLQTQRMLDIKIFVNPEVVGKDVKRQQLVLASQAFQNYPELNRMKVIETVFGTFDFDDPEEFVNKPYDPKDPFKNPAVENKLLLLEQWVDPDPKEDLAKHLQTHIQARMSANYQSASDKGKMMLDQHIQLTNSLVSQMINQQAQLMAMAMGQGMTGQEMPKPGTIGQGPMSMRPMMTGAGQAGFRPAMGGDIMNFGPGGGNGGGNI